MNDHQSGVSEPVSPEDIGENNLGSLVKSVFTSNLNSGLALALVMFMAVFAAGTILIASSETTDQSFNLPNSGPAQVLGQTVYNAPQGVFVALGYKMADYSADRWNARIDYYVQGVKSGSIYVNRNLFVNNVTNSGSTYTGYNLVPNDKYEFIFYSSPSGQGKILGKMAFVAPEAPAYGYYAPPAPPPSLPPLPSPYGYSTPSIAVLSPQAGSKLAQGSTYIIGWSTTGNISQVKIVLISTTPGIATHTIVDNLANTGSYYWSIPDCSASLCPKDFAVSAGSYQVQIFDTSTGIYGQSGVFNITAAPSQVQPRVGQLVSINSTVYLVGDQGLFGIPNIEVFNSWCFSFTDVVSANSAEIALPQIGVLGMRAPGQALPAGVSVLRVSTCGKAQAYVNVSLDPASPASRQVTMSQSEVVLSVIDLQEATGKENVTLSDIDFTANGTGGRTISNSGDLSNTFLNFNLIYNGNQLGSSSSWSVSPSVSSNGLISFHNLNITVPAGGTIALTLRANVNSWANGAASGSNWIFGAANLMLRVNTSNAAVSANVANGAFSHTVTVVRSLATASSVGSIFTPNVTVGSVGVKSANEVMGIFNFTASPAGDVVLRSINLEQSGTAAVMPVQYTVYDASVSVSSNPVGTATRIGGDINFGSGVYITAGQTKSLVVRAITTGFSSGIYTLSLMNWTYNDGISLPSSLLNASPDTGPVTAVTVSGAARIYDGSSQTGVVTISGVGGPTTLNVGQTGTWVVNASDSQNQPLTYYVNWGDTSSVVPKDNPSGAIYSSQQTATFTHTYLSVGVYTVNFKVSNPSGNMAYASITVSVSLNSLDHAPQIVEYPSQPATIQVGQSVTFNWSATDKDNDNLSWNIDWGDGRGGGGACSVQPAQNQQNWSYTASHVWFKAGSYTVKVTVSDCKGGTDSNVIKLQVGNVPNIPSLTIVSPSGGEQWLAGSTQMIQWNRSGDFSGSNNYYFVYLKTVKDQLLGANSYPGGYVPVLFRAQNLGYPSFNVTVPNASNPGNYYLELDYADANGNPLASYTTNGTVQVVYNNPVGPGQVQNLKASSSGSSISLFWSALSQPQGNAAYTYNVYRGTGDGFTPSDSNLITRTSATSYVDNGLSTGIYYYVVAAQDANGNLGKPSAQAWAQIIVPVQPYFTQNGQQTTSLVCGTPMTFNVPGYSQVWLVQTKNGVQSYNGAYNVPSASYSPSCTTDLGTYVNTAYTVVNGKQGALTGGQLIGSVTATISKQNISKPLACGSLGDVNNDGMITSDDYDLEGKLAAGLITPSDYQRVNGDINQDGRITLTDWVAIGAYLNGNISTFSGCPKTATPYFTQNNQQTTSLVCGTPMTFNVPGYSQVWLVQTKNGMQSYNGAYNVPSAPYAPSCTTDLGTYVNTAYTVVNGQQGQLIGSVTATIKNP